MILIVIKIDFYEDIPLTKIMQYFKIFRLNAAAITPNSIFLYRIFSGCTNH
jgi:hypothetical protein